MLGNINNNTIVCIGTFWYKLTKELERDTFVVFTIQANCSVCLQTSMLYTKYWFDFGTRDMHHEPSAASCLRPSAVLSCGFSSTGMHQKLYTSFDVWRMSIHSAAEDLPIWLLYKKHVIVLVHFEDWQALPSRGPFDISHANTYCGRRNMQEKNFGSKLLWWSLSYCPLSCEIQEDNG